MLSDAGITRALAEKVMGWTDEGGWWVTAEGRHFTGCSVEDRTEDDAWWPLTSIADAWMVRDRLAEWGNVAVVRNREGGQDCASFCPDFSAPSHILGSAAMASCAPRAICYAALRVVGVEPEG